MNSQYEARYTQPFRRCLDKHKDKKDRVKGWVERILKDPFYDSHLLDKQKGKDLRGKRSRHFQKTTYCMVYIVCEECISKGFRDKGYNDCSFCSGAPRKIVIFLAFDTHDEAYSTEWSA